MLVSPCLTKNLVQNGLAVNLSDRSSTDSHMMTYGRLVIIERIAGALDNLSGLGGYGHPTGALSDGFQGFSSIAVPSGTARHSSAIS